jgi:hypothetical protein
MECIVCKNFERDMSDIQRRIVERTTEQRTVRTTTEKKNIGFELGALSASRSEIESLYLKHRNFATHQEAAGAKIEGHLSFT